jgi:transcriptional regulator GlxA family with amidase domain
VSVAAEQRNRFMLRARDAMDRDYAKSLDIPTLARIACLSEAHFIRSFRAVFGEMPHAYLQRRRVERAMFMLRETDRSVTEICFEVGFRSVGSFTRTFTEIVGEPPTTYRWRAADLRAVPASFAKAWTRPSSQAQAKPSSFGEAKAARAK